MALIKGNVAVIYNGTPRNYFDLWGIQTLK